MGFRQVKFLLVCCVLAFALENSEAFAQSLLKGATPSSFSVPAGWKVYATQDFESGALNSSLREFTNNGGGICTEGETFLSPVQAHSGSKSTCQKLNDKFHQNNNGWGYESMPSSIYYISFWEYLDSNFSNNIEHWLWQALKITSSAPFMQEVVVGWLGQKYNDPGGGRTVISQGMFTQGGSTLGYATVPKGAWHQWEVWFHANTPGQSDGFVRIYLDGLLSWSKGPTNLNASVDMAGSRLMLGGVYTVIDWGLNKDGSGSCTGFGTPPGVYVCYDYGHCPCNPQPPIFNRYMDDIIVLVPGSGGSGDITPPDRPTGLTLK